LLELLLFSQVMSNLNDFKYINKHQTCFF